MTTVASTNQPAPRIASPGGPALGGAMLALTLLTTFVTVALPLLPVERQFMEFVNQYAHHSAIVDRLFLALSQRYIVSGIPLLACIWYIWCKTDEFHQRRWILTATLAAFGSAAVTRLMQVTFLPYHPRPMHSEALSFHVPFGVDIHDLNDWSSFPSDHASVYFGVALVVWRMSKPLGVFAMALAALLCFTRIYLGYHFPTDIIGGAAIGMLVVCIASLGIFQRIGGWLTAFSYSRPELFYPLAFILTYLIASLFGEVRGLIAGFFHYA